MVHDIESVLVIIVSTTLTVFLILGIVVLGLVMNVLRSVRRVVDQAERVVERAGDAAEVLRNTSGPLAIFKLIRNIVKSVEKSQK